MPFEIAKAVKGMFKRKKRAQRAINIAEIAINKVRRDRRKIDDIIHKDPTVPAFQEAGSDLLDVRFQNN